MTTRKYLIWNFKAGLILGGIGIAIFLVVVLLESRISGPECFIYYQTNGEDYPAFYSKKKRYSEKVLDYYELKNEADTVSIQLGVHINRLPVNTEVTVLDTIDNKLIKFIVLKENKNVAKYSRGFAHISTIHNIKALTTN